MKYDSFFDTDENKTLIAICTRRLIRNIGIGGIIWGIINTIIGVVALQATMINIGLVALGLMMLGTGIQAIRNPTLGILKAETIVTALLFFWNLGISILNFLAIGEIDPYVLIIPLVITAVFSKYYKKLGHLREQIESVEPEKIKQTKQMCKTLVKTKLKDEPFVVQTTNKKCRAQLMDEKALFIQRDLMRAFLASKENIQNAIAKPNAKSLKMIFNHPVGKLTYQFDKKSSLKIKDWLTAETKPKTESESTAEEPVSNSPESILLNRNSQE